MTAVRSMPFRLRRRELLSLAAATFAAVLTRPPLRAAGSNLLEATAEPVRGVLPNGLVVLVEERPSAETVALQLTARSGSRDDGDLPGINAVTSRMLLQGTTSRPSASALLAAVTGIGGQLSRNTGTESSIIDCLVPSTDAPVAFDVVSDAVTNSLLAPRTLAGLEQGIL
ncbi:MAG: insulinase family protein, partial [Dehalococcoidia bacterium]